ncbi:MAG: YihY/virulence factor BrkB family protein [Actinomycetales bacterium]
MTSSPTRTTDRPGAGAASPREVPASGWRQIMVRAWQEQSRDKIGLLAGAVAYFGFLAIFPALIAAISIYGLVYDADEAAEQVESFAGQLPDEAAAILEEQLTTIAGGSSGALTLGVVTSILLALWAASGGMGAMIKAINIAYAEQDERSLVKGRVLALGLTLGAIVVVLVALVLIAVLPLVLGLVDLGPVATLAIQAGRFAVLAGVVLVALALLYRWAADRADPRWRWASPGAVAAAVGWLVVSALFSAYVTYFGSYSETYGSVAGAAILLLWLYYSAFVVLLGAEINAESERQTQRDTTTGPERPIGRRRAHAADDKPASGA